MNIQPSRFGGTGIDSKSPTHTLTYPHRLEAGTQNLIGIIGLSKGLDIVTAEGVDTIRKREIRLLEKFCSALKEMNGVRMMVNPGDTEHVGLVTIAVAGKDPHDVAAILDADFGIAVRAGLHCAPLVHRAMGTCPGGGVRFSLGPYTTAEDIEAAARAMSVISRS
jgi:selenocysteine lyase/cysteine desulfurase